MQSPEMQVRPQAPQLAPSVARSTHTAPHLVRLAAGQAAMFFFFFFFLRLAAASSPLNRVKSAVSAALGAPPRMARRETVRATV